MCCFSLNGVCHHLCHRCARIPALFASYACPKLAELRHFSEPEKGLTGLLNRYRGSTSIVSSNLIPSANCSP
jgi:hypothetical protein